MDIKEMDFDDLLAAAVKSEINSREVYEYMAERSDNFVTVERFQFLAAEEEKHERFVRMIHERSFGGKELHVPEKSPVPMPFIRFEDNMKDSEIIEQAMDAEIASRDFYKKIAEKAEEEGQDDEIVRTMEYLSGMEQNHYNILESESERIAEFEQFDEYWPEMHIGP
ncbi:MAG: ferritin family protein [Thermoplasmata archaeon]